MNSTEPEHTPGPWKYRYEGSGDYEVYTASGGEIGAAWSKDAHFLGFGKATSQNEANARLIAAAPELLEACKLALPHHQGGHSQVGFALKAAIAKAEEASGPKATDSVSDGSA